MENNIKNASFFNKKIWIVWSILLLVLLYILYSYYSQKNELEKDNILYDEIYKTEVEKKLQNILVATLEASYFVSYLNYKENLVFRDDMYYQKDLAKVDYSFVVNKSPKFIIDNGKCVLTAEISRAKRNPINKQTVLLKTSHKGNTVKNEDVAKIINDKLQEYDLKFREANYKIAENNIRNLLDWISNKHNCALDLQITN
jgi:hypothetical protein